VLEAVPDEVVHTAKRCIIDTVGVTIAAAPHELTQRVLEYAREHFAKGSSQVLGFEDRLAPVAAALVNGTAGHVLDFDDTSYTGIMHGSTVALPAALAALEHGGGDGKRLLEAFIVGSEVTYAVAMQCTSSHYFKGWWSTATFGAFGAAAAAAKALGLSEEQTLNAIALAGAQANGQKVAFGTDTKPYLAGNTAAIGVESALLAAKGLTGPADVLEDDRGFIKLLNDGVSDNRGIDELGKVWRLIEPGIMFKQFPVCSAAHAAIELTQRLLRENHLSGVDIAQVICEVTPTVAISLVHNRPDSPQQAQFSMPFSLGAVLAYGTLGVEHLSQAVLAEPGLQAAMAKVEMRRDDELHREAAPEGARVTLVSHKGEEIKAYLGEPTGMPGNPMTDDALQAKYLRCCEVGGVAQMGAKMLLEHLLSLEARASALI
jgi:2-methylcitrate dehydratase PrpD